MLMLILVNWNLDLESVFLGYMSGVKDYKLWCHELKKVIVSRSVIFDKTSILHN